MSHSPETPPDLTKDARLEIKPPRLSEMELWQLRLWRFLQRCLVYYLGFVLVLSLLQRSLMYVPTRAATLPVSRAGLPYGTAVDISFKSDDGLELHGWHVLPTGKFAVGAADYDRHLANGSEFVILFFHGNGGNRLHRVEDYKLLRSLGCHIIAFDYRGYGENAGQPSEMSLIADAHAAWKDLTEGRQVPANRILIYGESLGGGVAVRLASDLCEAKEVPGGLILCSTFSSMVDAASYHYPWLPVRAVLKDRYLSDRHIKHMTAPLLMLHGERDRIVPYRLGRKLFDAAPQQSATGIPKTFVDLPRADHNDILFTEEPKFREGIKAFLQKLRE